MTISGPRIAGGPGRAEAVLDGEHRLVAFDAAFAALVDARRAALPVLGEPFESAVGPRYWPVLRAALMRAEAHGSAISMLSGWGPENRNFSVAVAFDAGARGYRLVVGPLEGALHADADGVFDAALGHNMTEMIAVFDSDYRVRAFNPPYAAGAAALTGRHLQVGDSIREFMTPASRPAWEALCGRAFAGESLLQDFDVELSVGLPMTYEISMNPLRARDGAVGGVLLVSRNVTARRADAQAVSAAADFRRAVLEAMEDAICVVNRDGDIIEFKGARGVPMPVAPERLVGMNVRALEHVPCERILGALATSFETGEPQRLEYDALVAGAMRSQRTWLHPLNAREALWVVRDVTHEKAAAQRLAFTDRMVSLGTLAAGVAHELNNPLQYVLANLELSLERAADMPEQSALLSDSLEGLRRVTTIVGGLRAFSRADEQESSTAAVGPALLGAVKLAARAIRERATLELDVAANALVVASDTKLTQVFLNLLMNAADALEPERKTENVVRVRTTHLPGERICIEISDNGAGVPPEVRPRIFDPFFTTKPAGQGTGLGLAIASQIVRAAGGDITVESAAGRGTTFRVVLPVAPAAGASSAVDSAPSPGAEAPDAEPHHVLLVDDDPQIGRALARLLSNYDITVVESGEQALAALEAAPFDAVLCDVTMPGMSGIDLMERAAAHLPAGERSFVIMTGGVLSDGERQRLTNASALLHKPFNRATVQRALDEAIAFGRAGAGLQRAEAEAVAGEDV